MAPCSKEGSDGGGLGCSGCDALLGSDTSWSVACNVAIDKSFCKVCIRNSCTCDCTRNMQDSSSPKAPEALAVALVGCAPRQALRPRRHWRQRRWHPAMPLAPRQVRAANSWRRDRGTTRGSSGSPLPYPMNTMASGEVPRATSPSAILKRTLQTRGSRRCTMMSEGSNAAHHDQQRRPKNCSCQKRVRTRRQEHCTV